MATHKQGNKETRNNQRQKKNEMKLNQWSFNKTIFQGLFNN